MGALANGGRFPLGRLAVFGLRLLPTLAALGTVLGAVYGLWYPGGHARLAGIGPAVLVLAATAVVTGPVLTAFVYRPGKPGLAADIAVLAVLETLAVAALATLLYLRQPAYAVFAIDRFEVVTWAEIDQAGFAVPGLARRPGHAPRLVHAVLPADPAAYDRLLDETVFLGLPDIDRRPAFWQAYASAVPLVLERARPLAELLAPGDARRGAVLGWLAAHDARVADYRFLPVRGRRSDAAMLVHARIGYPVGILHVDPWEQGAASGAGSPTSGRRSEDS